MRFLFHVKRRDFFEIPHKKRGGPAQRIELAGEDGLSCLFHAEGLGPHKKRGGPAQTIELACVEVIWHWECQPSTETQQKPLAVCGACGASWLDFAESFQTDKLHMSE